jgi:hypothetical protein
LRCQFGTSSWGGTRYLPFAFTVLGVVMLPNVLQSKKAIDTSVLVVRAFNAMANVIDQRLSVANVQFSEIYQALIELADQRKELDKPRKPIGFLKPEK